MFLLPFYHRSTDLVAKMYGLKPKKDKRKVRKSQRNWQMNWNKNLKNKKNLLFILCIFSTSLLAPHSLLLDLILCTTKDSPQSYSFLLVIYSRCQYGTENWIHFCRFCAPFRCKSSTQNKLSRVRKKEREVMWMLKYNLNAICEFKRSSNMSRGRQTKA